MNIITSKLYNITISKDMKDIANNLRYNVSSEILMFNSPQYITFRILKSSFVNMNHLNYREVVKSLIL